MRYGMLLVLLSWMFPALAADAGERQGYLIGLRVQGERVQLNSATALPRFEQVVSLPGKDAWQVELRDPADALVWSAQVPSPAMLALGMPRGQPLLMALRVPQPAGEALLRLRDPHGEVRFSLYLDAAFAEAAQREREAFVNWLESTPKAIEPDAAAQAKVERYIDRQRAGTPPRRLDKSGRPEGCASPDTRFIPELARTAQPCLPVSASASKAGHVYDPGKPASDAEDDAGEGTQAAATPKARVVLNGRVLNQNGSATGSLFYVYVNDGTGQIEHLVDSQGRFTAYVETGRAFTVTAYPPAPWLGDVFSDPGLSAQGSREFRLEQGIQLTGKVTMPGATIPADSVYAYVQYERRGRYLTGVSPLASDGGYHVSVPRNVVATLSFSDLPAPFLQESLSVGPFSADAVRDIAPVRGITFRGNVRSDRGDTLRGVYLYIYPAGNASGRSVPVYALGRFDTVIEPGRAYTLFVGANQHFDQSLTLPPQHAEHVHDIVLERGLVLSGQVRERADGPVVAGASVRTLDASLNRLSGVTSTEIGYSSLLRRQTRHAVEAGRQEEIWPEPLLVDAADADIARDMYVPPRHPVTITVRTPDNQRLVMGRVEIWQNDRFLMAARTSDQGVATLTLPAGQYTAQVRPHEYGPQANDTATLHLYGHGMAPRDFSVAGPTTLDLRLLQSQIARMRVLSTRVPGETPGYVGRRFELLSGDTVVATSRNLGEYDTNAQGVRFLANLHVPSGQTYRLRAHIPGMPSVTSEPFATRQGGVVRIGFSHPSAATRWTGKVKLPDGQPAPGTLVYTYDRTQTIIHWVYAGTDGSFDAPACEGCTYYFNAPREGNTLAHSETLGEVPASFNRDVHFKTLTFQPQAIQDRRLQRLWGSATGQRHDILFIGDGYTARNETFTDRNGNGVWDGVLYYDLNRDGVWNRGEPFGVYGNAPAPVNGQDPSVNNEPFNDLNGDGAPNIGEAQIFFRNARDYLRALFGFDYWRDYQDTFRAWTYLAFSGQAGMTVRVPGVGDIVTRNSLLNALFDTERYLLSIDYTRATQLAAEILPSVDTIVVMINQPIPAGRANAFILANGGLLIGSPNDATPAHEFGHNVGWLADEYDEFDEVLTGGTESRHMSRSLDKRLVPWRDLLPEGFDTRQPTPAGAAGVGLFEGGMYQASGIYRSTSSSTMRDNALRFSEFQKALMDERLLPGKGRLSIAPVKQCDGTGLARIRVRWDARGLGVGRIQVRSGSLDGNAFVTSSTLNSAATTGKWGRDGGRFLLVDADTGALLDIVEAKVTTTGCPSRFVAFDPAPGNTCRADLKANTKVYWNVTTAAPATLRLTLEHPDGTVTHTTRTARRGSMDVLAAKGTKVRLRSHATGANLATATLDVNALGCNKVTFTVTPNPIPDCDGDGKGVARVAWDVRHLTNRAVDIHLRTLSATRWHGGGANGSRETGNWLEDNDKLFLIDRATGTLLGEQTVRVRPGTPATCPGS